MRLPPHVSAWTVSALLGLLLWLPGTLLAEPVRVQVVEPFLELHTGPGRGYPVFHVLESGDKALILMRRTEWFKVRGESGVEGWVDRAQMERTLTDAGVSMGFGQVLLEDYLARRFEIAFVAGLFDKEASVGLRAGYRLGEYLTAEAGITHVPGTFSSSTVFNLNLVSNPFPDWRISPTFTIGAGYFDNVPQPTLVAGEEFSGNSALAGIGLRSFLSRHFVARVDWRRHVVLAGDESNREYDEFSAGFGFFF
ncbi:conserved hypothetical protein [Thioalkalivibrio sulfidiphilus HL-EbGr7]|uniref:SH3b domain-containing protein n=1 Tax=Thioalkalivibrio sulfidiphilus (strain HL-EbGR7) TaxID=396588 RepID=B8GLP3_THISH|nr:SH3 domain-containing protein [Thioalkalivibrio sulfidiphilus]ACL71646.1 conserved hypothetical protein [Thioalkalivibrio sulfidiphilus HL-EbGr7]